MSEEEQFDEIFRSKFSKQEFLFDEENWEKAEAMIEASAIRKRAIKWSAVFLLGLFVGIAMMLPFVGNKNEKNVNEISKVNSKEEVENEKNNISAKELKVISNQIYSSQEQNLNKNLMLAKVKNISSQKTFNSTNDSEKDVNNNIFPLDNSAQANLASFSSNNPTKSDIHSLQTQLIEQSYVSQIETPKSINVNEAAVINNLSHQVSAQVSVEDSAKSNTCPPFHFTDSLNIISHDNTDSSKIIVVKQPPAQKITTANIFSIKAGTNFALGWNNNDTTEARGFNPIIGFSVTHIFNLKWMVQSGIHYESINHLKEKLIYSDIKYDFGYSSADTAIMPKTLHYIVLPVQIIYSINSKNLVGIEGSAFYLFNTTSKVITYTNNNSTIVGEKERIALGYMQNLNQWNASLSVIYRRRITDKLTISGKGDYGLMDIKDNGNLFERNISLSIFLTYDLFNW